MPKVSWMKRVNKAVFKTATLFRDNAIMGYLQKLHFANTAFAYNWLTTSTVDSLVTLLAGKVGMGVHGKYIALIIIAFLL